MDDADLGPDEPPQMDEAAKRQIRAAGMTTANEIAVEIARMMMERQQEQGRPSLRTVSQMLQLAPYMAATIARYYISVACHMAKEPIELEEIESLCENISSRVGRVLKAEIEIRWPGIVGNALEAS